MRRLIYFVLFVSVSSWIYGQAITNVRLSPDKTYYDSGEKVTIYWNYSGIGKKEKVKITLWREGTNKSVCLIADDVYISRTHQDWIIPAGCINPRTGVKEELTTARVKIRVRWKKHPVWGESNWFRIKPKAIPDLIVDSITFDDTHSGTKPSETWIRVVIKNAGSAPSPVSLFSLELNRADGTQEQGDVVLDALSPGGIFVKEGRLRLADGNNRICVKADSRDQILESNERNNEKCVTHYFKRKVSVEITRPSRDGTILKQGEYYYITWLVEGLDVPTQNFRLEFFKGNTRVEGPITLRGVTHYNWKVDLVPGDYILKLSVAGTSYQDTVSIIVKEPEFDLKISSCREIGGRTVFSQGESVGFMIEAFNTGPDKVKRFKIKAWSVLGKPSKFNILGKSHVEASYAQTIEAGRSAKVAITVKVLDKASTSPYTMYFKLIPLEPSGKFEFNRKNNLCYVTYSVPLKIKIPITSRVINIKPDLTLEYAGYEKCSHFCDLQTGKFVVNIKVKNIGNKDVEPSKKLVVYFEMREPNTGKYIWSYSKQLFTGLQKGKEILMKFPVEYKDIYKRIKEGGRYLFIFKVDPWSSIKELNENNNELKKEITLPRCSE